MTILDEKINLGSIDSMFEEDHFVCCKVENDFVGVTKAFCGADTVLDGTDQDWVDEVGCDPCNRVANEDTWYCPLGYDCENEDIDD